MRILFIKPYSLPGESNVTPAVRDEKYHILLEPLELEILAAMVPEHEVQILDLRADEDKDYLSLVAAFKPDIVGMSCYTIGVYITKKILKKIKEKYPGILTVVGGHHATLIPEDFYEPYIDIVAIGDGEHTFPEIVARHSADRDFQPIKGIVYKDRSGKFIRNELRELTDMKEIPSPRRDLVDRYRHRYHMFRIPTAVMELSRGCKHRCNFCSVWKCARGTFRSRVAEKALEELKNIKEKMIFIVDPNSFYDAGMVESFIEGIRHQKIKKEYMLECSAENVVKHERLFREWGKLGLKLVLVGVESIRERDLKDFHKGISEDMNDRAVDILRKAGILPYAHFVISPEFEYQDFEDLKRYLKQRKIAVPAFGTLTPLPGSDLYDMVKDDLIADNYEMFDLFYSLMPTRLRAREFYRQLSQLYRYSYGLERQLRFWLKKAFTMGMGKTQSLSLSAIMAMHKILAVYRLDKNRKRRWKRKRT